MCWLFNTHLFIQQLMQEICTSIYTNFKFFLINFHSKLFGFFFHTLLATEPTTFWNFDYWITYVTTSTTVPLNLSHNDQFFEMATILILYNIKLN